jgi:hypothetical protein
MTRRDKLLRERDGDPYQTRKKLSDPSACTDCGARYRNGRWEWGDPPIDAKPVLCPACHRSRDGLPAGLLRNIEEREAKAHALKRIMRVEEQGETVTVTTTHPGLARSLGDALHHAYGGALDYHYPEEGTVLRVRWARQ